jgi:dUTP pyrophosphatase
VEGEAKETVKALCCASSEPTVECDKQVKICIHKLYDDVNLPVYATEGSAGCDLQFYAAPGKTDENVLVDTYDLWPGSRVLIHTGIRLEIPEGYEGQIRPRSGLACRHGLIIPNAPGTIDSDYRGEVKVCLWNLGGRVYKLKRFAPIAQLIFASAWHAVWDESSPLSETKRGSGGFGSTDSG